MKKVLTIVLVIAMIVAMAIPALAKNAPVDKLTWTDGFGFHCNAAKGNGATDVINLINDKVVAKGSQKDVFGVKNNPIALVHASGTAYDLVTNNIECATCGRIDWVTYSNNNGVINGKNIQAHHSGSPRYWAQASATLVLIDIVDNKCTGEITKTVEKETKSGKYTTDEKAVFNFDIPEGYDIIEGEDPIIVEFAAIRGQNIDGGKVVALRITTIECKCEGDFSGINNPPVVVKCDHALVCSVCYNAANKGLQNQSHPECHNHEGGQNTFFCLKCDYKETHWNNGNNPAPVGYCNCPVCCD